jgi:hypothetical protein
MTLSVTLLAIPIVAVVGGYLAVRMSPRRTPNSARRHRWERRANALLIPFSPSWSMRGS